jgi:anti-sigma factor RsiW
MNCPDEQDLVAYADGELDADDRAAIERHLPMCSACSAYVADMRGLTSLGRASLARLPAAPRPAMRLVRPAWPRVVFGGLAAAAAVLVAALVAGRLMSEPKDRQIVQVGPTTSETTSTQSTQRVRDAATPVVSNDELFREWAAAARRRAPVRLVPMDEVASFRPPVDRPVTADDLNPRG